MVRFIVSLVLLVASIVGPVLLEGGTIRSYLGISAFLVEVLVPFFAMLAVWRLSEIGGAWRDAFRRADPAAVARSVRIWEFAEKVCYAAGVIGFMAGTVIILSEVSASASQVGRAFAVGLLGPLYAVLLAVLCRILRARVQQ
jgi:flagellar motor component MotA